MSTTLDKGPIEHTVTTSSWSVWKGFYESVVRSLAMVWQFHFLGEQNLRLKIRVSVSHRRADACKCTHDCKGRTSTVDTFNSHHRFIDDL